MTRRKGATGGPSSTSRWVSATYEDKLARVKPVVEDLTPEDVLLGRSG